MSSYPQDNPQTLKLQQHAPSPSPFGLWAERLIEQGYTPLPVKVRGKAPDAGNEWEKLTVQAMTEGDRRRDFAGWCRRPGQNIGLICGKSSGNVVALDYDVLADHENYELGAALVRDLVTSRPGVIVMKRGKKGFTIFCRIADGEEIETIRIRHVIDVLSTAAQTVLPPSIHKDTGLEYVWLTPDTLLDTRPEDLPIVTAAEIAQLIAALRVIFPPPNDKKANSPAKVQKPASDRPMGAGGTLWDQVNQLALAALDAWVPALNLTNVETSSDGYRATADWRASGDGRALHERGRNIGIHPNGIKDFGDEERGYTAIDLVMAARRVGNVEARDWLRARVGPKIESYTPPASDGPAHGAATVDSVRADTGEIIEKAEADRANLAAKRITIPKLGSMIDTDYDAAVMTARSEYGRLNVYVTDAQPGLGKTHALLGRLPRFYYMGLTNALAYEVAEESGAAFVRAQSGKDPKNAKPNCAISPQLETVRAAGGAQSWLCGGCTYRETCGVVASWAALAEGPPRIASTHGDLLRPQAVGALDRLVVIDEMPHATLVGKIDENAALLLGDLVADKEWRKDRDYTWHALEFIRDAIENWHADEAERMERGTVKVAALKAAGRKQEAAALDAQLKQQRVIPASIFNGISAEDLDADRARLHWRAKRRRRFSSWVLKHHGMVEVAKLAERIGGEHQRDHRRMALLDAVNLLDFDHGPLAPFISADIAIDLKDGRNRSAAFLPLHSIKLRPISQEIAKAGVVLLMTATPASDDYLRTIFRTTIAIKSPKGRYLVVNVEPKIIRQGAPYVARPEQNTVAVITGGNPATDKIKDAKTADAVAALINECAKGSAEPMPVATVKAKAEVLAGKLVNVETRTHASMTGINAYRDRQHMLVLGDQRRAPDVAEIEATSLLGIITSRGGWVDKIAEQKMTDGSKAALTIKLPTLTPMLAALDWPGESRMGFTAPLAGLSDWVEKEEVWRAQMDLWQAVERIRLLHPHPAGLPEIATIIADMFLPFPVDSVTSFRVAALPLLRRGKLNVGISVIPGRADWAQALGIKDEISDDAWRDRVNTWAGLNPDFSYKNIAVSRSRVQYAWRCRQSGTRGGKWTTCISRDPPTYAMPRLAKALNLTLILNPEDGTTITDVMPTGRTQLEKYGFARTEWHAKAMAKTIKAEVEANPAAYREITVRLKIDHPLPQGSDWLVRAGVIDPAAAIRKLLADSATGDKPIEIKELTPTPSTFSADAAKVAPQAEEVAA